MSVTIHAVLAGAYRGQRKNLNNLLTHASLDGGQTAVCGRVRDGALCDLQEPELTCAACKRKIKATEGGAL